jgi:hypothetical protein
VIYRMTVPNFLNFNDDLTRKLRDELTGIAKWDLNRTSTGVLELMSERLTAEQRDLLAGILVRAEVQFSVEDLSDQYLLVATTAPETYDYPYTMPLGGFAEEKDEFGRRERHVAVQKERKDYQFGRYSSGLHGYRILG